MIRSQIVSTLTKRITHLLVFKFQMSPNYFLRGPLLWLLIYINIHNFWRRLTGGNILFISRFSAGCSLTSNNILLGKLSDPPNTQVMPWAGWNRPHDPPTLVADIHKGLGSPSASTQCSWLQNPFPFNTFLSQHHPPTQLCLQGLLLQKKLE